MGVRLETSTGGRRSFWGKNVRRITKFALRKALSCARGRKEAAGPLSGGHLCFGPFALVAAPLLFSAR